MTFAVSSTQLHSKSNSTHLATRNSHSVTRIPHFTSLTISQLHCAFPPAFESLVLSPLFPLHRANFSRPKWSKCDSTSDTLTAPLSEEAGTLPSTIQHPPAPCHSISQGQGISQVKGDSCSLHLKWKPVPALFKCHDCRWTWTSVSRLIKLSRSSDAWMVERPHGVAVITSALHAEGRQFDPGCGHALFFPPSASKGHFGLGQILFATKEG